MNKKPIAIDSGFLFAEPDFFTGMGSVLDFEGSLVIYNTSYNEIEADRRAIQRDWIAVGKDLFAAIKQQEDSPYEQE